MVRDGRAWHFATQRSSAIPVTFSWFSFQRAGTVKVAVWNPLHRKLTTADGQGLIIVWLLHKGTWFEEMINDRGKSTVRDMRWRANGQEICICYEDGHVILGTVDGSRLWSKDFDSRMSHVEWAPDGRWLLFASAVDGTVTVYTHQGARVGNLELHALRDVVAHGSGESTSFVPVAALEWYDGAEGYSYPDIPCLAIAFENGRVQLMREADDPKPLILDTGLRITQAKWNTSGTMLAVAGAKSAPMPFGAGPGAPVAKETSEVQFYTPFGKYVTAMKVPGGNISSLTWEGGGLRLAVSLAVCLRKEELSTILSHL
jgi:WD repeat-containing protein 35